MNATDKILDPPLIGIIRGFSLDQLGGILPALIRGGLKCAEITMNTSGAPELIAAAVEKFGSDLWIGAGTVTNRRLLESALDAGASFIVTPTLVPDVIAECAKRDVPVFPGALTPTEIYSAWELGATMVKIFPGDLGGASYVRALKGPFPYIKLLPTGGVDLATMPALIKAGANGFGIGSPLLNRERIETKDFAWLEQRARDFVEAWRKANEKSER